MKIKTTVTEIECTTDEEMGEVSVKIVNRGKCMLCGKELTEGLFFCKECKHKAETEDT